MLIWEYVKRRRIARRDSAPDCRVGSDRGNSLNDALYEGSLSHLPHTGRMVGYSYLGIISGLPVIQPESGSMSVSELAICLTFRN